MVKISYCPNCDKSFRFHFKRRFICRTCKEPYKSIDVRRTKYFLIQLPLLIVGFIIICYSAFLFYTEKARFFEPLGYTIFGFAFVLFALAFQILDNKKMETLGKEKGRTMFDEGSSKEESPFKQMRLIGEKSEKTKSEKIVKRPKKSIPTENMFIQPNKPGDRMSIQKSSRIVKKEPTQVKLDELIKPSQKKKKARKIRRAI